VEGTRSADEVESSLLELVALGTVADITPLVQENRHLVIRGLRELNRTQRPGLLKLFAVAGMRPGEVTSASISYALAPRINATGRLDDAAASLDLLLTNDPDEATKLAQELDDANQRRQRLTAEALDSARRDIRSQDGTPSLLMVKGREYPVGIVGLVASRLVEEFYRPALVVTLGEHKSRGSARSIEELDIMGILVQCEDILEASGGHARAAGFTVETEKIEELERRLLAAAEREYGGRVPEPRIAVDCRVRPSELTWELYQHVLALEPYGFGNPEPLFHVWPLRLLECRAVGREQPGHLRLRMHDGKRTWNGIWFGMGAEAAAVKRMTHVELVAQLRANDWGGTTTLELQVRDLRPR
jgi:single-stranded-DNA-specific exonuclease